MVIGSRSFGQADRGAWQRLVDAGCELIPNQVGRAYREEELIPLLAEADAIITGTDALTGKVLRAAPRLKVISKHGVGVETIDLAAAKACGITVTATAGVMDDSVADLAVALLLAVARQVVPAHVHTAAGGWKPIYGMELADKQAGLIGMGRIGKKVAIRLKAFGMRVVAHDPYPDAAYARANGIQLLELPALLERSDVVSLHAPGDRTVLGAAELARMKAGSVLINTARGILVDETALCEALRSRRLAGAGLDAFREEPPVGSPLLSLKNVVVTPHMGGLTREALIRMGEMAAENVLRVLKGQPPVNALPSSFSSSEE